MSFRASARNILAPFHHFTLSPFLLFAFLLFAFSPFRLSSQTEASDFARIGFSTFLTPIVSDYQCVGINPANLGFVPETDLYELASPMGGGIERQRRSVAFSIAEGGVSLHSDALRRQGLLDMITQTTSGSFTEADKLKAAQAFINKGVRFNIDVFILGAAYQSQSWGGVAVAVRERIAGTYLFSEAASKLAFEGRYYDYFDSLDVNWAGDTIGYSTNPKTYSELFDGTRLSTLWFRDISVSYGIEVFKTNDVNIYVGATAKYLMGYAYIDAFVEGGALSARSAVSPILGVTYGKATTPSFIPGNEFVPVGDGFGFDLGVTLAYKNFSLGMSVVDIGEIQWDGNVFNAKDTILNGMSSTGFDSYNIFEEAQKITGEGNYFKWEGLEATPSTLPSRFRVGASWEMSSKWRFGADAIFPFNSAAGALGEPLISAGADWRPLPWLRVGAGIAGGGEMGFTMPIAATFSLFNGVWELGFQSRDMVTYLTEDSPVMSLVLGVARIRL